MNIEKTPKYGLLYFFIYTTLVLVFSQKAFCQSKTGISFEKSTIDIGEIEKGDKIEIEYFFTNTGIEDIEIAQIGTCECTKVLHRPYLPIKPNQKSNIKVLFDSKDKEDEDPVELEIWLKKEDPKTGMRLMERIAYTFNYKKE